MQCQVYEGVFTGQSGVWGLSDQSGVWGTFWSVMEYGGFLISQKYREATPIKYVQVA